jgi:uncharacterized protein (TIGR00730 family)
VIRVCVFSGSSAGARPVYTQQARNLGQQLSQRGIGLVYGGSSRGLMGVVARAVLAGGGEVIGVIPQHLLDRGSGGSPLGEQRVVGSMHERKALMADLADAFIAMPGGFGTLDELFEIVTWAQLGLHSKPIGLLNVAGYFDRLDELVQHAVAEGFVEPAQRGLLMMHDEPARLLDALLSRSAQPQPPRPEAQRQAPILR